ncbi:DUF2188 domain-containing protein [Aeromonas hydrophila]|uniref:DUF2188 domain-containing protein n=1 Tax=Aeromonas hydrophila TaxID=644 RepID=UPI0040555CB8
MDKFIVEKRRDKWALVKEGNERASKTADTKAEMVKLASAYVGDKGGSVKIRKLDGTFEEERTYPRANDPKKSKG